MRGDGRIYQPRPGGVWMMEKSVGGKLHHRSSETRDEAKARKRLKRWVRQLENAYDHSQVASIPRCGHHDRSPYTSPALVTAPLINRREISKSRPKGVACPICRLEDRLEFDHDHVSGQHRGWICGRCNRMLGLARDDARTLLSAAVYLSAGRILARVGAAPKEHGVGGAAL